MLCACSADKLEHTEMDSSDTNGPFQSFIKRNSSLSKHDGDTSDGYYIYWATLSINTEQTLERITGLHLELISGFEKGFRSLDRNPFQAFVEWGKGVEE